MVMLQMYLLEKFRISHPWNIHIFSISCKLQRLDDIQTQIFSKNTSHGMLFMSYYFTLEVLID